MEPLTLAPVETTVDPKRTDGTSKTDTNGTDTQRNSTQSKDKFDPNFTKNVINATGPKAAPRICKVMASLIQHIHDFARENEITVDEWMAGVEMVRLGLRSTPVCSISKTRCLRYGVLDCHSTSSCGQ